MTVKVRPYRNGGWEVDIRVRLEDGRTHRERRKSPVESKSGSKRWGQDRERYLLRHGPDGDRDQIEREVPTLAEFAPKYVEDAEACRRSPATVNARRSVLEHHLVPLLGALYLDEIDEPAVARLLAARSDRKASTVNQIVGHLITMLRLAARWKIIPPPQLDVPRLKEGPRMIEFYTFEEYARLVKAAATLPPEFSAIVLLAGDAGLRRGEICGLDWDAVDLDRRTLEVRKSIYRGQEVPPKSGRARTVPLTARLCQALKDQRHLIGPRVLYSQFRGRQEPMTAPGIVNRLHRIQKLAGLPESGPHRLRHTFCSHLAMRRVPARSIQELAGHASLTVTQRYMHLSPDALRSAVDVLEAGDGDGVETSSPTIKKYSGDG